MDPSSSTGDSRTLPPTSGNLEAPSVTINRRRRVVQDSYPLSYHCRGLRTPRDGPTRNIGVISDRMTFSDRDLSFF